MQKQEKVPCEQIPQQKKQFTNLLTQESQYLSSYLEYLSHLSVKCEEDCLTLTKNFHRYGIKYSPESPYLPFKVRIQNKSKNYQIVIISIVWGHFQQQMSIINYANENNRSNKPNQINENTNTMLYEKNIYERSVMFKSQVLTPNYQSSAILTVIKQLFIAKIGSALGFGPCCHMQTFFDLYIYENCIQFGMQKCLNSNDRSFQVENQEQLKASLLMMHKFRIIHFDIKPKNIMFSQHFNKYVLIDFNLSEVSNYQLGKKVPISFRGTVNFCCPEMAQNFLAGKKEMNRVDPYYNDIFCLKESIKYISTDKIKVVSPIRVEYLYDVIEEEQEQNAILIIKKMMFFGKWTQIYDLFANSLLTQKILRNLTQFLYEIDLTQDLQTFYHTCIPSWLKETFFTRQFEYLLKKKWMLKAESGSTMVEKKLENVSRLQFVHVDQQLDIQQFNKEQTRDYLNNEGKFASSQALYFNIFLEYVSLSSNKFGLDHNERKIVSKKCIEFILDSQENKGQYQEIQGDHNSYLIQAVLMILQWALNNDHKGDISLISSLFLQLLSFIVILDIGSIEENLKWFERMLSLMQTNEDKICILLSLKQLNEWNKNIVGPKGNDSRLESYEKIAEFVYLELSQCKDTQLGYIVSFALRQKLDQSYENNKIKYEGPNLNLNKLVKRQEFGRFLQLCTYDHNALEKICSLTKAELANSHLDFQYSYFILYERYKLFGGYEFCIYVYKIFQQNLKDPALEKKFSIYYKKVISFQTNKIFMELEIGKIEEYLDQLKGEDIYLADMLVERVSSITDVLEQNRQQLTLQEYYKYSKGRERIHNKLLSLFQSYFQFKLVRKNRRMHKCFNPRFQLNIYIYDTIRFPTIENYHSFLMHLKRTEQYAQCNHCALVIDCFIIICQQTWVVSHIPPNSLEIFCNLYQQFIHIKDKIFAGSIKTEDRIYFRQAVFNTNLNYAIFCTLAKEFQLKLKGIRNLYFYVKNQTQNNNLNFLWVYLGAQSTNKDLTLFTIRILFQYDFEQCIYFLILLAKHLNKNLAASNFNIVLLCFTELLINIDFEHQLALEKSLRREMMLRPQLKSNLTIYLYCLAMTINNTAIQEKLFFQITPNFIKMPFHLQIYYSASIFLYFAKKLRSQRYLSPRKLLYINNKLVKLLLNKKETKIGKGKKYQKFQHIYGKLLVRKLKRIDGPLSTIMDENWKYLYSMKYSHTF